MYRWSVHGKEFCIYARTLSELRQKEKRVQRDAEDGIDSLQARKITLNDMFRRFMEIKGGLKASTRSEYHYLYKHYVAENIGLRKIDSVRFSDILKFFDDLFEKGLKPGTLKVLFAILHQTFALARRDGIIRSNPTDGVLLELKNSHCWQPTKRHALTPQQQEAFMSFTEASPIFNHWLPLFTCFLGTGMRIGELTGLCWQDVDFSENTISVNHSLSYRSMEGRTEFHISTPKTTAGCRSIPMLAEVKKSLLQIRKEQLAQGGACVVEVDGYRDFIFTNRDGRPFTPQTVNQAIIRIYKAYNEQEQQQAAAEHREALLLPHFSAHTLRHSFCSRYCECEDNIKTIQSVMGHSDCSTTLNIYSEISAGRIKQSFENLEKIKIS